MQPMQEATNGAIALAKEQESFRQIPALPVILGAIGVATILSIKSTNDWEKETKGDYNGWVSGAMKMGIIATACLAVGAVGIAAVAKKHLFS